MLDSFLTAAGSAQIADEYGDLVGDYTKLSSDELLSIVRGDSPLLELQKAAASIPKTRAGLAAALRDHMYGYNSPTMPGSTVEDLDEELLADEADSLERANYIKEHPIASRVLPSLAAAGLGSLVGSFVGAGPIGPKGALIGGALGALGGGALGAMAVRQQPHLDDAALVRAMYGGVSPEQKAQMMEAARKEFEDELGHSRAVDVARAGASRISNTNVNNATAYGGDEEEELPFDRVNRAYAGKYAAATKTGPMSSDELTPDEHSQLMRAQVLAGLGGAVNPLFGGLGSYVAAPQSGFWRPTLSGYGGAFLGAALGGATGLSPVYMSRAGSGLASALGARSSFLNNARDVRAAQAEEDAAAGKTASGLPVELVEAMHKEAISMVAVQNALNKVNDIGRLEGFASRQAARAARLHAPADAARKTVEDMNRSRYGGDVLHSLPELLSAEEKAINTARRWAGHDIIGWAARQHVNELKQAAPPTPMGLPYREANKLAGVTGLDLVTIEAMRKEAIGLVGAAKGLYNVGKAAYGAGAAKGIGQGIAGAAKAMGNYNAGLAKKNPMLANAFSTLGGAIPSMVAGYGVNKLREKMGI